MLFLVDSDWAEWSRPSTSSLTLRVFYSEVPELLASDSTGWTANPLNPPAAPLAVRSPYLSAWLRQGGSGVPLNGAWPTFWSGGVSLDFLLVRSMEN